MKKFIIFQLNQLKRGGLSLLVVKVIKLFKLAIYIPSFFAALFLLPLIYSIRPFVIIRFSKIQSDRIGFLATSLRIYLCYKEYYSKKYRKRYLDFFCTNNIICNYYILSIMKKHLFFVHRFFLEAFIISNNFFSYFFQSLKEHNEIPLVTSDHRGLLNKNDPLVKFTAEEENIGRKFLKKVGISEKDNFICLHVRDNTYLKKIHPKGSWDHHSFRDADIDTYKSAILEITQRGYFVIIMGVYSNKQISISHPNIINYADSNLRNDFLDVYLSSKCLFLVSGGCSGFIGLPMHFFNKPHLLTNYAPFTDVTIGCPFFDNFIVLAKKLQRKDGTKLTISDSIKYLGKEGFVTNDYKKKNLVLVDNSEKEILDATIEMLDKLENNWHSNQEYLDLQKLFWDLFIENNLIFDMNKIQNYEFKVRYSHSYLMQNKNWLQ